MNPIWRKRLLIGIGSIIAAIVLSIVLGFIFKMLVGEAEFDGFIETYIQLGQAIFPVNLVSFLGAPFAIISNLLSHGDPFLAIIFYSLSFAITGILAFEPKDNWIRRLTRAGILGSTLVIIIAVITLFLSCMDGPRIAGYSCDFPVGFVAMFAFIIIVPLTCIINLLLLLKKRRKEKLSSQI